LARFEADVAKTPAGNLPVFLRTELHSVAERVLPRR
jgi:hypothetical protein